ncbi:MAG: acyltransferase [Pseudomonadota bacterium]|nr:acyltransferase [Pseudomonadales bacterium]MDY6921412.1 acyltransferase [Pseudomonadota bacterium]
MLSFLPAPLRGMLALLIMALNTVLLVLPLLFVTLLRLLIPVGAWSRGCARLLIKIAETWMDINNLALSLSGRMALEVRGLEGLHYHGWYLVSCNHQSWSDILILQRVFNRRIPMLKFFLKQQLIWVPLLGVAWWALDFPFMKRYSKAYLEKHPEKKGKDLATTRRACEKFKSVPVSVMNFLEGTRYTAAKHEAQDSPYRYLLKPKSGGIAFVLSAMGGQLRSMLDVTIVYHDEQIGFWDLLCGRIHRVTVEIQERSIPAHFSQGDYENDPAFRAEFQRWVNALWVEKDARIAAIKQESLAFV